MPPLARQVVIAQSWLNAFRMPSSFYNLIERRLWAPLFY